MEDQDRSRMIKQIRETRSAIRELHMAMGIEGAVTPKTAAAVKEAYFKIVEAHETYIYESKGVGSDGE